MLKNLLGVFKKSPKNEITNYLEKHLIKGVQDTSTYERALRHKSLTNKETNVGNNERLEFLGDAVLDTVVAEILYKEFPQVDEGKLTKYRSYLVNRNHLNNIAKQTGLSKLTKYNLRGREVSEDIYGNAFEAFVAAVFVDKGYSEAFKFVRNTVLKDVNTEKDIAALNHDYKSRILEWGQNQKKQVDFKTEEINGVFKCRIEIEEKFISEDFGSSKKEAHQKASKKAYYILVK